MILAAPYTSVGVYESKGFTQHEQPHIFRGSLLTRSLADIVKKEDFVLDSEYLITMLVVVPK